ncbi:diaminopimelate decarboxylase [Gluconobacter kanchanaburiensis]|uniref:Diaminopimelate decarboxylase n=1 Tax=Gluconobacter kanchanaburiensis NBRC 103587 TaxID=1307948 RepID=A0A511B3X4_9PROT|nr:diaminopimelate decarboxylase [Gluconobacter kanchanaburiensis]MBF0860677.1 diaminopimelate decarboxylase [Gluconobacter kanchanaburiensis]GBR69592.1 diaminopimelate decarboxylase [Gluconobacter kanchanaburiensis NBRC 103587]GEK95146.1 diaminopimelate decarboxylase [Gluconobacter kanchanaburiensis NBRC 103587]
MSAPLPSDPATDPSFSDLLETRPTLTMDVRDGLLFEGVPLHVIAAAVGTPCWITGAKTLRRRARALKMAFEARDLPVSMHFAMKSQDHQATLTLLRQCGYGVDIVSGGEMQRALHAGISPSGIVFSGVGKSDAELRAAIEHDIAQINVESVEELYRLDEIARACGRVARAALRVNPDVDADTHDKISTGRAGDKFGIEYRRAVTLYGEAASLKNVRLVGLAVHLGSQMLTAEPFRKGYARLADMVREIRAAGHTVEAVDCGGGLGIRYRDEIAPSPDMLAGVIAETLGDLNVRLSIEPGRWLSAPTGILLSRVIETKAGSPESGPNFVVIDAAMNDLARPSLYESWHGILPVAPTALHAPTKLWDIVGPVCESSDIFARDRALPATIKRGDLTVLLDTGAYGSVMSSTYNSRPFAAQVLVDNGKWDIIRQRQSVAELIASETVPDWLTASRNNNG